MIRFLMVCSISFQFFTSHCFSDQSILQDSVSTGENDADQKPITDFFSFEANSQSSSEDWQNDDSNQQHASESPKKEKYFPYHLYAEFLYFKISEDAIKYAEKFPQDSTITPRVSEIKQDFNYSPGVRVGAGVPTYLDQWEIGAEWTYLYSHPSIRRSKAKEFGILASLVIPTWGAFGNNAVEHVKGSWHLTFNSVDLNLQRKFHPTKSVLISAWGGILAGFIDQKISVHYKDFRIDFIEVTTPQKVVSKQWMSSVGPYMGLDLACRLPKKFDLFFKYSIGLLGGMFSVKTKYKDFSKSSDEAHVTLKDSYTSTFTVQQMQAGISKDWTFRCWETSVALGWEFQQWAHQMNMRWFSSFTQAQDPADLSFYGPFLRILCRF
jgi:hypothetical protein